MISSVSSSYNVGKAMQPPPRQSSQSLTDEQKKTVSDIISNYDSSNMTQSDFESLRADFENAGIKPSEDLRDIMDAAGFDPPKGSGPQGAGGKGKPPEFSKLMEKLSNSDISEYEVKSFIESLQNENGKLSGLLMDGYA